MNRPNPILAEAQRGGIVESFHRGALAIVDAQGAVFQALGDIERPIFPRSAVKLLQALPLVASGAADALGLTDEELALACASHGGEPQHAATAAGMLAKASLDASVLECGAHWPYHDGSVKALAASGQQPSALHNNCSGKHSGFVCLGCHLSGHSKGSARSGGSGLYDLPGRSDATSAGPYLRGYVGPDHPVMREVTAALQSTTGYDLARSARGTDGCSIPTHAIPLRHLAHAYAKVATGQGLGTGHAQAAKRLRQAVARAPHMVAGTGRFDSRVAAQLGGRVYCKVGAEGVYCAAFPERGLGVAIKMDDGNNARACEVVMAAVIQQLLTLNELDQRFVHGLSNLMLRNWNGLEVGRVRAVLP